MLILADDVRDTKNTVGPQINKEISIRSFMQGTVKSSFVQTFSKSPDVRFSVFE